VQVGAVAAALDDSTTVSQTIDANLNLPLSYEQRFQLAFRFSVQSLYLNSLIEALAVATNSDSATIYSLSKVALGTLANKVVTKSQLQKGLKLLIKPDDLDLYAIAEDYAQDHMKTFFNEVRGLTQSHAFIVLSARSRCSWPFFLCLGSCVSRLSLGVLLR
jgi:hypothetical protein